jgi:hypothetical protein
MRIFVTLALTLGVAGWTATAGSAQALILNPLVVIPAQPASLGPPARPELPERIRPEGQVFIGTSRLNWRVVLTMGTFDANGSFTALPDSKVVVVAIPIPTGPNGFRWKSPGTLPVHPAPPNLNVCQAELQFCVGGVVWLPQFTTNSWSFIGVSVLKISPKLVDFTLAGLARCALFHAQGGTRAIQVVK